MNHVTVWAICVLFVLLTLKMVEGYITRPEPLINVNIPSNVQDTITGDKKYVYM
jgi:hypothetical protein